MSRAITRHHQQRMKAKFRAKQKANPIWGDSAKSAGIYANHGRSCSCFVCSGSRKYHGPTIQELREAPDFIDPFLGEI